MGLLEKALEMKRINEEKEIGYLYDWFLLIDNWWIKLMKKIIAVDDEWDLLFTIKKVLEYFNDDYKVKTLDSGKKLFQHLKKEIPDLILLDIMMPDVNGGDIHNKIKSTPKWSRIPIIFILSVVDDTSKRTARAMGDDYLEKPFTFDDLNLKINNVLNKN